MSAPYSIRRTNAFRQVLAEAGYNAEVGSRLD